MKWNNEHSVLTDKVGMRSCNIGQTRGQWRRKKSLQRLIILKESDFEVQSNIRCLIRYPQLPLFGQKPSSRHLLQGRWFRYKPRTLYFVMAAWPVLCNRIADDIYVSATEPRRNINALGSKVHTITIPMSECRIPSATHICSGNLWVILYDVAYKIPKLIFK